MEKKTGFQLIFHYLKDDKGKLFLYLILTILTYIPALLSSFFWGFAIEGLVQNSINTFLFFLFLREGLHILFYNLLSVPRDLVYNYLEIKFSKAVIKDLYHKVTEMPAIAFENIGVGEFINRMTTDPDRVMDLLGRLIKMSCRAVVVLLVLFLAFSTSIILGIEIIIFSIIMGFISAKFSPKIKKTQEKIKRDSDLQIKSATENLTGIREIKALGIKKNIEERMYQSIDVHFKDQRQIRKYEVAYFNLNGFVYFILQAIILATAGSLVIHGKMTYALFIVLESYIWKIDDVVESISDFGINYNKVKVSLKRIDEIINNKLYEDEKFGEIELSNTKGVITFKDVFFRYTEEEDNTLQGLNLTIEPHKKVAIIGKSGNGKSTIFNLLLRYFDATKGEILIDGVNIQDLNEASLRKNISTIRQSPFLFNLTIMENFRLVKKDVTLEEVREVCKKSYIDEYIMSLPKQYETIIGEGGVNLSGGQKQRLAIARTLLINTKIILFDEATSALDNETQASIQKAIDNLKKDYTILIIAHRLSTVINCDKILFLNDGKIEDEGTHKKLLKSNKNYQKLYEAELID